MSTSAYVPPGWPAQVRPPGATGWEATAIAYLLDCCPPDFRAYRVLRNHPLVLAQFATHFVNGQHEASQRGLAAVRTSISEYVDAEVVEDATQAWLEQEARLTRDRRTRKLKPMSAARDGLLSSIHSPEDLRELTADQLRELSLEIRSFLIENVSQTGGHLGPNLGVIELTIAVHRVFHSPRDPIIFDTGHQSYVHKILTGRQDQFPTLRQRHGLSGYPSSTESEHDWVENSHASTALSYADGLAKAIRLQRQGGTVVAFVGDGSLTGGMAWEALNNIAASDDLPLVIVVNDNGRSYTPTVGGLARHLTGLRTNPRYEQILELVKRTVSRAPLVGNAAYDILHGIKIGLKDVLAPQGLFSDLGLKYVGPIDGHDIAEVERALRQA
jgi:1-deoxy-D-xylulose-5-phosphate synthase